MERILVVALALPLIQALALIALRRFPAVRDVVHVLFATALAALALSLLQLNWLGHDARFVLARPLPGLELAFNTDPLGLVFAAVSTLLAAMCALFQTGWLRAIGDPAPGRYMALSALAAGSAFALLLSADLLTFLVFDIALLVFAYAMLAHCAGDEDSRRKAAQHLVLMLGISVLVLAPAIIWTAVAAGALQFKDGGVLAGHVGPISASILLVMFAIGMGKAGLFPAQRWVLDRSGPVTSASAQVFAFGMGIAGGFGLLRVSAQIFGPVIAQAHIAASIVIGVAAILLIAAAVGALGKRNFADRLMHLCVAQLAAAAIGAMLGPTGDEGARFEVGWFAAALHLLASATAIAALAFAIAAVDLASGGAAESDIDGLGRKMPWTFGALALGGLGLSGAPPLAGAWAKLWLVVAVAEKGYEWAGLAIAVGALVALIAFAAPAVRALFAPSHPAPFLRPDAAPLTVVLPTAAAGFATLALALWMDPIALYLGALRGGQ